MTGIYISLTVLLIAGYVLMARFIGGIVFDGNKEKLLRAKKTLNKAYARGILFGAIWPISIIYCIIWWACWVIYHSFKKERD